MIGWSRVLRAAEVPVDAPFTVVQLRREARGCLSYLVISGGEALVVDPAPGIAPYLEEAAARDARITRVFDTHVHADHVSGARALARETGAALHLSEVALRRGLRYGAAVRTVADGDLLPVGGEAVRVVALPGHTTDMTGLLLGDAALIGGDSLFTDSVARPDLEAGDAHADEAARELFDTLRARVAGLPDAAVLLPCHYAGGRLPDPVAPTLGEVRARVDELALEPGAVRGADPRPDPADPGEPPADHRREPRRRDARGRGRPPRDGRQLVRSVEGLGRVAPRGPDYLENR